MKKKILLIIAVIMIISTIIRTVVITYTFLNFSNTTIINEANLIRDILTEVHDKNKFMKIIKNSRHIINIKFKNIITTKETITFDNSNKAFKITLPFDKTKSLEIIFNTKNYYKKLSNAIFQLIAIAVISLIIIILIVNYFLTPYLEILENVKKSTSSILKGHFNVSINTKLKGEAKEFVNSYNTFLKKLNDSFGVIEKKYTSLIQKEKSNDPLNDAKETIEQLANIFKFKRLIEDDEKPEDILNRLIDILLQFNINSFSLIGIDNNDKRSFLIYQKGEICCDILDNFQHCRAYRLKKPIDSLKFPKICPNHLCSNDYICLPFSAGGNFTGIMKIVINNEHEKEHIIKMKPYIAAYLNEVSAIIEAKYTLELLHNQTIKDPLTNLFNRRYLENMLPTLISAAQRRNEKIAFLMIDMDWFKKVNDTYGHKSGDIVLSDLAKILVSCVRKSDIVIRYGGEEFLIILQNIKDGKDALNVAEKIRSQTEKHEFALDEKTIHKTISIGISVYPEHCTQGWECIKYADIALYKAKNSGRNQVVLFTENLKEKYKETQIS